MIKIACVCEHCGHLTDTTIPIPGKSTGSPLTSGCRHQAVSDPQGKPVAFVRQPRRIDLKKHHRTIMAMVKTDMTFTAMAASIGCTLGGISGYLRRMGITARTRHRQGNKDMPDKFSPPGKDRKESETDENAKRGACSHIGHPG